MTDRTLQGAATAADLIDPVKELETAMLPYADRLRAIWDTPARGRQFDALRRYLEIATAPWQTKVARLAEARRADPPAPTLILVGQRGLPASRPDPQLVAVLQAAKLADNGRFHILFSGGGLGLEKLNGWRPAEALYRDFDRLTKGAFRSLCSLDQFSMNSGHQGLIISRLLRTMEFERLVICSPIEHIGRLAATLASGLAAEDHRCRFVFFGVGRWPDPILPKGTTRASMAFAPVPGPFERGDQLVTSIMGGEYAERYGADSDPARRADIVCPAVPPAEMLEKYVWL